MQIYNFLTDPCTHFETWKLTRVLLNSIHPIKTSLLEIANDLRGTQLLKYVKSIFLLRQWIIFSFSS